MRRLIPALVVVCATLALARPAPGQAASGGPDPTYDVLILGGTVYDGTGAPGRRADVAILGDRIVGVGDYARASARRVIQAAGHAVAPGFINMLSHATDSLLADPRSQSDIRQGVTTEIFGELLAGAPHRRDEGRRDPARQHVGCPGWNTLAEYLAHLERRGVAPNVASFVERVDGAPQRDRPRKPRRHRRRTAPDAGARPARDGRGRPRRDLVPHLCAGDLREDGRADRAEPGGRALRRDVHRAHAQRGRPLPRGHRRDDPHRARGRRPGRDLPPEGAGQANWPKLDAALAKIEAARKDGLRITADMYTYPAGATGLDACMPPWAQSGGYDALFRACFAIPDTRRADPRRDGRRPRRLGEPLRRRRARGHARSRRAHRCLKPLTGRTVADVAKQRGTDRARVVDGSRARGSARASAPRTS